jgi:hypothetical protein
MKRARQAQSFVALLFLAVVAPLTAAEISEVKGTYSGSWTPKEGVPEAVTIELKEGANGNLSGRFLTPTLMEFSKSSFNPKTNALTLAAVDQKSGKQYTLEAKIQGTELTGTLGIDSTTGSLRLIKWTFFPR